MAITRATMGDQLQALQWMSRLQAVLLPTAASTSRRSCRWWGVRTLRSLLALVEQPQRQVAETLAELTQHLLQQRGLTQQSDHREL